jgi:hypothetical protein
MNQATDSKSRVELTIDELAHLIPEYMVDGVKLYVLKGCPMGSFGTHLFCNDFMSAAGHADAENERCLFGWAKPIYHLPRGCWGSPEAVKKWTEKGGLEGLNADG